eukprot:6687796-Prymnesium_polylepis.1
MQSGVHVEAAVGQFRGVEQILAHVERRAHVPHHLVRARAQLARAVCRRGTARVQVRRPLGEHCQVAYRRLPRCRKITNRRRRRVEEARRGRHLDDCRRPLRREKVGVRQRRDAARARAGHEHRCRLEAGPGTTQLGERADEQQVPGKVPAAERRTALGAGPA